VLDSVEDSEIFFYSTPKEVRNLSGQLVRSKGKQDRENDLVDIGVFRLFRWGLSWCLALSPRWFANTAFTSRASDQQAALAPALPD
jgi:hypothetical protein